MRIFALDRSSHAQVVTYNLLRTVKPHTSPVVSSVSDATGTLLATGGADGIVKIWDIRGGFATHTLHGHSGVISALHFFKVDPSHRPDAHLDAGKKNSKKSRKSSTNDEDDGEGITTFRLASGDEDGKIRIWHLQKRKCVAILDSHVSVVRGLDFNETEQLLLSGSRDKTAMLWNSSTWKIRTTVPVLESIETVGFISNTGLFYTGGESGRLRLWWMNGQEAIEQQPPRSDGQSISDIIYSSNLDCLITIHSDQNLQIHSLENAPQKPGSRSRPLPIMKRISGTHDEVIDLAYVGGGDRLLAVATNLEEVKILSLNTSSPASGAYSEEAEYFGSDVGLLQGHEDIVICLDTDWSGHWLVTGAKDNTARLWRMDGAKTSFTCHSSFTGHAESLGAVALPKLKPSVDAPAFTDPLNHPPPFIISGSQDKTIKRWDIPRSQPSSEIQKISRATYTRKAHDKDINAISITYDSKLFASASQDRTVKIWSLEDGEPIGILRGHKRGVWSVAFAPLDTPAISGDQPGTAQRGLVITGSGDKTVKLWSLRDYSCLRTFEGHTNSVLKVLWMPAAPVVEAKQDDDDMFDDDEIAPKRPESHATAKRTPPQIASAGSDGLVKIWDASTGEVECTLDNHTDRVWALAVTTPATSPETAHAGSANSPRTLVSGAADAVMTFWTDTTSQTYLAASAASTARVEQDQELSNYMRAGAYREAITLALALNHPARLLSLFTSVVNKFPPEEDSLSGVKNVDEVLGSLDDAQLLSLLGRLRDWNTNVRTALVSQRILWALLRLYPAAKFTRLKGKVAGNTGGGIKEVLDALRVYTERHYRRWEDLMDESWLVEYTLREMDQIAAVDAVAETANGVGKADVVMAE